MKIEKPKIQNQKETKNKDVKKKKRKPYENKEKKQKCLQICCAILLLINGCWGTVIVIVYNEIVIGVGYSGIGITRLPSLPNLH